MRDVEVTDDWSGGELEQETEDGGGEAQDGDGEQTKA